MKNVGLVLEGGGLRGIYTSGILDYFLSRQLYFEYTIGVSAGAIYSASYVSRQKKRNIDVVLKYINDERYMGYKYLVKNGNYINTDFAFKKMSYELAPFDFETFNDSHFEFKVGAFNCKKGKTDFFSKKDFKNTEDLLNTLIASGSLPFFSKETYIDEIPYLDGGIADPVPIVRSILDGNLKNVVVLTEDIHYKKDALKLQPLIKLYYKNYPKVATALLKRHTIYNKTLRDIKELEKRGDVFVFRPSKLVVVDRLEKNLDKIESLYNLGIEDAKNNYERLIEWLNIKES